MIEPGMILRFAYRQFQTDGRLQNLYETLNEIKAGAVLLSFADAGFDDEIMPWDRVKERLEVIKTTARRLKKRKFIAELVLPSIADCGNKAHKNYLLNLFKAAAELGCSTIWLDDASLAVLANKDAASRKQFYKQLGNEVKKVNKKVGLGLLAAPADSYARLGTTSLYLAAILADGGEPLLAQTQPFRHDYDRAEILEAAAAVAISHKQTYHANDKIALLGNINQLYASPFHKAAESTQMQINLNVLFGHRQVILNCFDEMGTAPRIDNLYLQMIKANRKFIDKLAGYVPGDTYYDGIRIILPDTLNDEFEISAAIMFWRMGIPVTFMRVGDIDDDYDTDMAAVLCGTTPREMTREQFDRVFTGGVILDAVAAETIDKMGLPGLIGCRVGGAIDDVCTEILSFQAYSNRYYGHHTIFRGRVEADSFRRLEPFHVNARVVTEITRHGELPNIDGMVLFDNIEHNHRCVILPFELNADTCRLMLSPARQVHTVDILTWVQRQRLVCYVENTPDLVPFIGFVPGEKKIVLTMMNIGFDWAIDARVRFGKLPFKVKRVKELSELGKVVRDESLKVVYDDSYCYLHLNSDFPVPPMQMIVLILEG